MVEASDELALAQTGNRQFLHPRPRRAAGRRDWASTPRLLIATTRQGTAYGWTKPRKSWAIRQGWGGQPVRQEQAQGILVAALGMLAAQSRYAMDG